MTDPFAPPPGDATPSYGAPPPPPPYGAPAPQPYGSPLARPASNGMGTAALVLGILAVVGSITVVGGIVLGILAVVFGFLGRGKAGRGEATNGGMALAGLICGAVGIVLAGALVAVGVAVFHSDSGQKFVDCMDRAGTSTVAQDACKRQFQNDLTR
ncbi:MAG: DUF4190 domain-containing protein [Nocardioidaceae bacterium]